MSSPIRYACALAAAACAVVPASAAVQQVLLTNGGAAPGTGETLLNFQAAQMNDAGHVLMIGNLTGVSPNNYGLFHLADGNLSLLAKNGESAHGVGNGLIHYSQLREHAISDGGRFAYTARLDGPGVDFPNEDGIWIGNGGGLPSLYLREGTTIPGTSYTASFTNVTAAFVRLNDSGQLAFGADLYSGNSYVGQAIFQRAAGGGNPSILAKSGDWITGLSGATLGQLYDDESWSDPSFNNLGQVAFIADVNNHATVNRAIILASGNGRHAVAYDGMAAPGIYGATLITVNASKPLLNNLGQVAFNASIDDSDSNDNNDGAVWMGTAGSLQLVARNGNLAPDTAAGTRFSSASAGGLNDRGQVLLGARLTGGDAVLPFENAVYMGTAGDLHLVMREGHQATGVGAGVVWGDGDGSSGFSTRMNAAGQFAAHARLAGAGVSAANDYGLWIADAYESLLVAREGDALNGKTVASIFPADNNLYSGGTFQINNLGQVLYTVSFTDGSRSLIRYTPDLVWRTNTGGAWDDWRNWTVGIDPASIHEVTLATAASVQVTGPAGDRTVKKLTLGGGAGLSTLMLQNGATLTALQGTTIQSTGILTGDGKLSGHTVNNGKIQLTPDAVLGLATLQNQGVITGDGAIRAVLNNTATGRIQINAGKAIHFLNNGSQQQHNAGMVEVLDGELRFDNSLLNAFGGLIVIEDGRFRGGPVTTNWGNIAITHGVGHVFGDLDNTSTGKITVTGGAQATFFDDVQNNGTIHLAAGSGAVFLGLYSGAGSFTGTGTAYIEGDMRPGNSPAITSAEGDMVFGGAASLLMEIGGLLPAVQHDALHVGGALTLDGVLELALIDAFVPAAGDAFDLFDWGALSGTFDTLLLPSLSNGLAWDTSSLYANGVVRVTNTVPEPATLALAAMGALMALPRRRR